MLKPLLEILYTILEVYFYIMIAYVLLSWIPSIRESKLYYYLHVLVNPYLRFFRGIVVIGYFDFTPILGFLLYSFGLQAFGQFVASL
ncbi:MAG: YggT family protein [Bacillota bacterium]